MARGGGKSRGKSHPVLARCCTSCPNAIDPGHNDFALRQRIWRPCHGVRSDRGALRPGYSPHWTADLGRCPSQPRARLRGRDGDGAYHGNSHIFCLFTPPAPLRKVAEMTTAPVSAPAKIQPLVTRKPLASWLIFGVASLYFLIPLAATFYWSLRGMKDVLGFEAYRKLFADTNFLPAFSQSIVNA